MDYIRVGFSGLLTLTSNTNSYLLFRVCVIQQAFIPWSVRRLPKGASFFVEVDLCAFAAWREHTTSSNIPPASPSPVS